MKKYVLCLSTFALLTACSHSTTKSDPRNPAGVGDVGSVTLAVPSCYRDPETIEKNKALAIAAAKRERRSLMVNQEPLKNLNKLSVYESGIRDEFNNDSAMRDQVADILAELGNNGRNASQGKSYFNRNALYCQNFDARNLKIVRLPGSNEKTQMLRAVVTFADGYHGGYTRMRLNFDFEVEVTIDRGDGRPQYVPRFSAYMTKYPLYVGKEEADCSRDSQEGCN
ncbi:hypothetical protein [Bdellovibrio svalbardensis]|uniref:Lipoprotein n=1 Tax=Bdellovibrio svalbardensis TaxID=2972972 RepID=A0ABT6DJZ6_9BACT|nr:hypothetical protein [Bdellovibrio svalbardensis]MDG0817199.1 hypothetical protein [Bdellovibrio svalbardensis]